MTIEIGLWISLVSAMQINSFYLEVTLIVVQCHSDSVHRGNLDYCNDFKIKQERTREHFLDKMSNAVVKFK